MSSSGDAESSAKHSLPPTNKNPQFQQTSGIRNTESGAGNSDTSSGASSIPVWPDWAQCTVCCWDSGDPEKQYSNCQFYVLPCLHMICSKACLDRVKRCYVSFLACPKCKSKFNEESISGKTIRLLELIKPAIEKAKVICSFCTRGDPALSWCLECEELLCELCTNYHGMAYVTKSHSLSSELTGRMKSGVPLSEEDENTCSTHHDQKLTTFCESCEVKLCNLCVSSDTRHAEHKVCGIPQFLETTKKQMLLSAFAAQKKGLKLVKAYRALTVKTQRFIKTEKDNLVNEASAQFSILHSTIMNREMELRKEITEQTVTQAKHLNIKRAQMKSILSRAIQFNKLARDIRTKSSPYSILQMKNLMTTQFATLREYASVITDKSSYQSFIEFENSFVVDKKACEKAEKYIKSLGKVSLNESQASTVQSATIVEAQSAAASIAEADKSPITPPQPAPPISNNPLSHPMKLLPLRTLPGSSVRSLQPPTVRFKELQFPDDNMPDDLKKK